MTFDQLRNPAEGIGEVFFAVAGTMARNAPGTEALVHAGSPSRWPRATGRSPFWWPKSSRI
ncbi:MAG: hypothetical protein JKP98_01640 [Rhodobacteraceae bacterium]|nr:hypothetical protein [Paracoccaceae bacterium]